jgi:transcriptional regulator with XRE-family HTH domain
MEGKELRTALSRNLKLFRKYRNWSQADLAEKAGISITYLSDIERGNKWPHPDILANLATAFNVAGYEMFKPEEKLPDDVTNIIYRLAKDITASVNKTVLNVCDEYTQEKN